ncbi:MAG: NAD(P)/FAD-dependent oxidoreductase [Corynebacterium sp.]|nr:NAD(P)/FAD-dependent oxidoreductase [Corynebacterium sp.]
MDEVRRAVIVGSGPNGLTAACLLAREGWQVDVYEQGSRPGGAARSAPVLGEGSIVDLGAAGHPFGIASPAFKDLKLEDHGLEWAHSRYAMAHPLDDGRAAFLSRGVKETSEQLGPDAGKWRKLHAHVTRDIDDHLENVMGPLLRFPKHPFKMAAFGSVALLPARSLARAAFETDEARVLFAGSAVHAITPPGQPMTASFGLLFGALGMSTGWPVAVGGTQSIIDALLSVLKEHGGRLHTDHLVTDLGEFDQADAVILNLTPAQVLQLDGVEMAKSLGKRMKRWKYGPGSHKVDILLDGPIPWTNPEVGQATTVHVCGTPEEIQAAETEAAAGKLPAKPFVLLCQQQVADPTRAPEGKTVVWAYAHVPHGHADDERATAVILQQIERFAPGFRERIISIVDRDSADLERWNPNLVGGDVGGGATGGLQGLFRMPHRLRPGLYMASSSTDPGGGVHGMPGVWAARAALRDFPG